MDQKIKLDDKEYSIESLNDQSKAQLALLRFTTARIQELNNMQALMQRAKNSYVESLKQEMLSSKSGFLFGED